MNDRAAQASTPEPSGPGDAGSTPAPSTEVPDDARTWQNHCVGCGDPIRSDQRWCSRSCYAIENLDPEGVY